MIHISIHDVESIRFDPIRTLTDPSGKVFNTRGLVINYKDGGGESHILDLPLFSTDASNLEIKL